VNKENLKKWAGRVGTVVVALVIIGLIRKFVVPRLPASVQGFVGMILG
jgi:hypothetical protein